MKRTVCILLVLTTVAALAPGAAAAADPTGGWFPHCNRSLRWLGYGFSDGYHSHNYSRARTRWSLPADAYSQPVMPPAMLEQLPQAPLPVDSLEPIESRTEPQQRDAESFRDVPPPDLAPADAFDPSASRPQQHPGQHPRRASAWRPAGDTGY